MNSNNCHEVTDQTFATDIYISICWSSTENQQLNKKDIPLYWWRCQQLATASASCCECVLVAQTHLQSHYWQSGLDKIPLSHGLVTVTHLQSIYQPQSLIYCWKLCERNWYFLHGCRCYHAKHLYYHIERKVFECFTMFYMFQSIFQVFHDVLWVFHNVLQCLESRAMSGISACTISNQRHVTTNHCRELR